MRPVHKKNNKKLNTEEGNERGEAYKRAEL
jgi:hypothetical protein